MSARFALGASFASGRVLDLTRSPGDVCNVAAELRLAPDPERSPA